MKKIYIVVVFIVSVVNINAQVTDWLWAKNAGGFSSEYAESVATDSLGNVYVTGNFSSSILVLGPDTLINSNGIPNVFLIKYDATGDIIWAKSPVSGMHSAFSRSVATDVNGNIYITGEFNDSTIIFGTDTLVNTGKSCIFLTKYDAAGNLLWAKSGAGVTWDFSSSVTTDLEGNVYITGRFESPTLTFGTETLTNNNNSSDVFLVKYDSSGKSLWAKSTGSSAYDDGTGVKTDTSGNVYLTGTFGGSISFGSTTLTNTANSLDIFLTKYNAAGKVIWAQKAGGTSNDNVNGIATDLKGNIYLTGTFPSPTLTFKNITITNTSSNGVDTDIFLVKYDASGNAVWAKKAGGTIQDFAKSIAIDVNGAIYIVGYFYSSVITFGTITLDNNKTTPSFITKYDALGNAIWAKKSTGVINSYDYASDVITDLKGNIYFTGNFESPTTIFGIDTLVNTDTLHKHTSDAFLVKLGDIVTGIETVKMENSFTIAPNPFLYETNIIFNEEQENIIIKIIDMLGKEIIAINFTGKQARIEKGQMEKGVYFVQLTNKKKNIEIKRMIIL